MRNKPAQLKYELLLVGPCGCGPKSKNTRDRFVFLLLPQHLESGRALDERAHKSKELTLDYLGKNNEWRPRHAE
jgi:hypothetical protein